MIELLVLDVDGCLTKGDITYSNGDEEFKTFNVKDGLGVASWVKLGKKVAIITGRKSDIVEKRAKELGVTHLHQGVKDKPKVLNEILQKENLTLEQVAAIGDDMNDLKMLKQVKYAFTPNDGVEYLHQFVDRVLSKKGGEGAVREMIDTILKFENLDKEFVKLWL